MFGQKESRRTFFGVFIIATGIAVLTGYMGNVFFLHAQYMYSFGIKEFASFGVSILVIIATISVILACYNKLISWEVGICGTLLPFYLLIGLGVSSGMEPVSLYLLLGCFFPATGALLLMCSGCLILINEMEKGMVSLIISLLIICSLLPQALFMYVFSFYFISLLPVIVSLITVTILLRKIM
ncbi:MAG: hypothetical protein AB1485_06695 [Candidatus Thermoplasmatota archaeon]